MLKIFQTFDHAKLNYPKNFPGENFWSYMELMINAPFYFAEVLITEDDEQIYSSYMFSNPRQLDDLSIDSRISLTNIYVITPPHVNKSNHWKMDAIAKISAGVISEDGYESGITIFETKSGFKYFSTDIDGREERIENIQLLISD